MCKTIVKKEYRALEDKYTSRTRNLIGDDAQNRIIASKVAVFGVGGVGSYVVEALARAGVGEFILVDGDVVSESDVNRQLIATTENIGEAKVTAAKKRIMSVNPKAKVTEHHVFYLPDTRDAVDLSDCDYIVDAIDNVTAKLMLAAYGEAYSIPVISSMGTGNKLDPSRFYVTDISKTAGDPLARVMRRECRARGIKRLKVVVSDEEPIKVAAVSSETRRAIPASISFVPSAAGLVIAGEVIRDLAGIELKKRKTQ